MHRQRYAASICAPERPAPHRQYPAESVRAVRVPLAAVEGVRTGAARQIVHERLTGGPFAGLEDFYDRLNLKRDALNTLVKAGAFDHIDQQNNRREAYYVLQTVAHVRPPGGLLSPDVPAPDLPYLNPDEQAALDLTLTGVSVAGRHPLDAHRARLRNLGAGLKPGPGR